MKKLLLLVVLSLVFAVPAFAAPHGGGGGMDLTAQAALSDVDICQMSCGNTNAQVALALCTSLNMSNACQAQKFTGVNMMQQGVGNGNQAQVVSVGANLAK